MVGSSYELLMSLRRIDKMNGWMDGFKLYVNSVPKLKIVIDPYLRKGFSRSVCGCAMNPSDSDTNTSSFLHSGFSEFPSPWHITE